MMTKQLELVYTQNIVGNWKEKRGVDCWSWIAREFVLRIEKKMFIKIFASVLNREVRFRCLFFILLLYHITFFSFTSERFLWHRSLVAGPKTHTINGSSLVTHKIPVFFLFFFCFFFHAWWWDSYLTSHYDVKMLDPS